MLLREPPSSSRICVKNLPKYISEDRLREFFSQKGEVTDAKLLRTKDGKSRQFGFIGYRTEQEAKEALKYFNSSYLDTSRINCEIAHKVGDPNIPRPWSRYSLKQEENLTEVKKVCPKNGAPASSKGEKKSGKKASGNDDPQLQEFLQVMQPRVKSKLWANDSLTSPIHEQTEKAGYKNTPTKVLGEEKSKHRSLGSQAAEKSSNLAHDEVISDMDYFKSRVKKKWSDSESSDEEDYNDNNGEDAGGNHSMKKSSEHQDGVNPKVQHDALKREPSEEEVEQGSSEGSESEMIDSGDPPVSLKDDKNELLETGRVFVRNLPYSATEDELEEHFSKFGNVSQVHLVVDKDTKQSKGIAYVVYTLPESAARSNAYANESSKTFKQRRENERKASEASGNTQAWNSLFMRPDTVVENIARKFGVSKSDLLEREADDLAVRIALGETQVIAETKKALVNAGVNLDSLEEFAKGKADGMKRSNHVILVKNLPYGSSEGEAG
ncbi:nucleotide/nucleic acid binding protein [Actinidia rufa]|uniref:Nucleotide/nucleic acid binding protein n=1 Tax=Actinidia rufa TaxID=165716 RepID=A0A7J0GC29_9ERIC|nr:nucleotide/nucleic acid binding protein [Actinidia rufa]